MSYQIKKNIVEEKFKKFRKENNISNIDDAFMYFIYAIYNDLEYSEIDIADIIFTPAIIDGSQDKQIDIISISEDEDNQEAVVKIFQIKNSYGFSSNILIQMKNGLEWILKNSEEQLSQNVNTLFVSKIRQIREIISKYPLTNIDFEVFFVTLGNEDDIKENDEYTQEKKSLVNKFSNFGFRSFEFFTEGASQILDKLNLLETKGKKIDKSINILYDVNKSSLIEMESEKFKSIICTVCVCQSKKKPFDHQILSHSMVKKISG